MKTKIKIVFLLIAFAAISCSDDRVEGTLLASNSEFEFVLKNKVSETLYLEGGGYPETMTVILEIKPNGQMDLVESLMEQGFSEESVISYLSFGLQKEIQLQAGEVMIPLSFFHFERSFDLKKSRTFLAAFDLSSLKENTPIWLTIDSGAFGDAVKFELNQFEIYKS